MKIGVDIRVLMDKYYSGVSEYAANLLLAIFRQDKRNNYRLFYNSYRNLRDCLDSWNSDQSRVVGTHFPNKIFNYFLQKIFSWPKLDKVLGGVDIFWSPHFNFSALSASASGLKKIITVHDLSFLRYPEFFSARKNFWHRALKVKQSLRAADRIIAVSENTKHDIVELVGIAPEKIRVIYPGNNMRRREVGEAEKKRFFVDRGCRDGHRGLGAITSDSAVVTNEPAPFILYLGTIEPRKNIDGLIEAYNMFRADDEASGGKFKNIKLILAGGDGWRNRRIYSVWKKSSYKADIKFLGYVSQTEKEILYSAAAVFAYPSYYEGFGFPPLEALTYGLPVVCSNVSSLPEVVGEAALTVNPFATAEIADALRTVLNEEKVRAVLIAKGYERARRFSWDKAAGEYLELFQEVYEENKRSISA
ncbi:TPA: hypothetical protein DCZ15_03425 [Candidatus Falkowbacteria bacterium]|nr:MAG: Glycosyl transferase group 1 [Candidatus Falkowbacteria bacterium GW2011_GWF2_43_32]HBA36899.1 hypothetical protein [Candidatus Falkowbacteria bacterium]